MRSPKDCDELSVTNWTAGAKLLTGTMENPDARAAKPWNRPATTRVPIGKESVTLSPMSKVENMNGTHHRLMKIYTKDQKTCPF